MAKVKKSRRVKIISAIAFVAIFIGLMVFLFSGDNFVILQEIFREDVSKEEVQASLEKLGFRGYFTIGILSMLQVVLTFLPAEPVQVMAGISFGLLKGSAICLLGVIVGNTIIYILYKIYGEKLEEFFQKNAEFDFEVAAKSPKISIVIFILYFLPAIPYGLICFFAASLGNKYPKYILLTSFGAIPSIFIGVGLGHMAIASSWVLSICVFLVLVALLVVLYKKKSVIFAKVNDFMKKKSEPYSSKTVAKKYNSAFYRICAVGARILFAFKLKIRLKKKVDKIEKPCIVLCNHGSFVDFLYAGQWLRKEHPHFITARMYFYHKRLGNILRKVGCFPKSMFTTDLENAKNCMRVLRDEKGVVAILPEARLSTVGKFEGIQETTYRFLQKMGVTVYAIRLHGDYFAKPKWGDKIRRGSLIEGEFNLLFTADEIKNLSLDEVKLRVDNALDYDEFEWLKSQPKLRYKSKTLAEGLENVLFRCPKCGKDYVIETKGRTVSCSHCGLKAELNDRYAFIDGAPFENFAVWYDWQTDAMRKEMQANPDYALEAKVTLKHSSKDGKTMLREAGKGICRLDKTGLTYLGEEDGQQIEKKFLMQDIYRLLFGAGEDFEIYEGGEIWYFVPEEPRSCVAWYIASGLFKELCGD